MSGTNQLFDPLRIQAPEPDPGQVSLADAWSANTKALGDYLKPEPAGPNTGQVSLADAWSANTKLLTDYLARQQQAAQDQGLWTGGQVWEGGHPTAKGVVDAAKQTGNALLAGTVSPSVHGPGLELRLNPDAPGFADRISTRTPGPVAAPDLHDSPDYLVGADAFNASTGGKQAKVPFQDKSSETIAQYPGFQGFKDNPGLASNEDIHNAFMDHLTGNIRALYDAVPDAWRGQAEKWYDGANLLSHDLAARYGLEPRQGAGIYAALSPQKAWPENVEMANRTVDILHHNGDTPITPEMQNVWDTDWGNPDSDGYKGGDKASSWDKHMNAATTPLPDGSMPTLNSRNPDGSYVLDGKDAGFFVRLFDEAHADHNTYRTVNPDGTYGDVVRAMDKPDGSPGDPQALRWNTLPFVGNAVKIYRDGSVNNISQTLGDMHKVRNFYNNLISPNAGSDVTIDTHAIAGANLMPWGSSKPEVAYGLGGNPDAAARKAGYPTTGDAGVATGVSGLYPLYAEAYRRVAADLGILPRQLQSATWEGVKGLYSDKDRRNPELVQSTSDMWKAFGDGRATADDVRAKLLERSIAAPDWARGGGAAGTPWQRPSY
jgi:hypothetical protein